MTCNCASGTKIRCNDGVAIITDARGRTLTVPLSRKHEIAIAPAQYSGWLRVSMDGSTIETRKRSWVEIELTLKGF